MCYIKLGACVVSGRDIVLYQVLSISSCIEIGCMYCDIVLYRDWIIVLYQDWSFVVSRLWTYVVSSLDLCCIKSMILIDGTLREWISNYGDGIVLYKITWLYYVIYC